VIRKRETLHMSTSFRNALGRRVRPEHERRVWHRWIAMSTVPADQLLLLSYVVCVGARRPDHASQLTNLGGQRCRPRGACITVVPC
jgi:hypothetical protein